MNPLELLARLESIIRPLAESQIAPERQRESTAEAITKIVALAQENSTLALESSQPRRGQARVVRRGWRLLVGWTCGVSITYQFLLLPLASLVLTLQGREVPFQPVDQALMWEVIATFIGLAGFRMIEKIKKVAD